MGKDYFVAGGWDRYRAISEDGSTWGSVSFSEKDSMMCSSITFGAGRCAILVKRGYWGKFFLELSSDGEVWETHEIDSPQVGHTVAYFDGKFIVCTGKTINTGHRPKALLSEDGRKWSKPYDIPGRSIMTHYAENDGRLVGIGPNGMAAVTRNGAEWKVADLDGSTSMISLAFGAGWYVGGGLHGQIFRSEDGLSWEKVNAGDEGEHLNSMIWDGHQFLAIGLGATYRSADTLEWERVPNENAPLSAVRGSDGRFAGNQWKGRYLVSSDGIRWKDQGTFERHVEVIAFGSLG